jgi:hypothetical protein
MEFIVMASSLKIRDHKMFWKKQFSDPTSIEDESLTPVEIRECKIGDVVRAWYVPNRNIFHRIVKITDTEAHAVTKGHKCGVECYKLDYLVFVEASGPLPDGLAEAVEEWGYLSRKINQMAFE